MIYHTLVSISITMVTCLKPKQGLLGILGDPCCDLQKFRKLGLPVSLKLHLFDLMITPICLYGSDWGCEHFNIQQFQLKLCKLILGIKSLNLLFLM